MAFFYADENFPLPVVLELRRLGHDVLTVQEAGKNSDADAEVLTFALSQNRAVLTMDRRDFVRLHRKGVVHAGIVVCTYDNDFVSLARRTHDTVAAVTHWPGSLIRVNKVQK